MHNDFERIQGDEFVQMRKAAEMLGGSNILLAGSGSTIAILFSEEIAARNLLPLQAHCPDWDFLPATSSGPID
jgi:4-diphosphocytidyl-2C-methyl-D-erythritol kinase